MKRSLLLLSLLLAACGGKPPTSFEGAAHFPGGPHACSQKCWSEQLEMASFVYSGEFASACVCRPRPTIVVPGAPGASSSSTLDVGDEVAVLDAMRARAEAARQAAARQRSMQTHKAPTHH